MNVEIWKDIPGFEGSYQISNFGRVKSLPKVWVCGNRGSLRRKGETILKLSFNSGGYCQADLSKNLKNKKYPVHRLMGITFLPNNLNKKCINHINSDRADNRLENLEWVTHSENAIHAAKKGRMFKAVGEDHPMCKISKEDVIAIRGMADEYTHLEISKRFSIGRRTVCSIINRKIWKHV
jgi:hypothetical protein